jgi:hypothetical protein
MNAQLMHLIAQQHTTELQQAGERARPASEARATRRRRRRPTSSLSARLGGGRPTGKTTLELEPTTASDR